MIDFLLSIEECQAEYDSRQAWKIRYPLSTILFLFSLVNWPELKRRKKWKIS